MAKRGLGEKFVHHLITWYGAAILIVIFAILKLIRNIGLSLFYIVNPYENSRYLDHAENLAKVQKQVRDWNANGRKTKMCTARPGYKTLSIRSPVYKKGLTGININMNNLIYIKTEENTKNVVCVEPMMTIGELTKKLKGWGWTLPVVPELNDLTIGGLVCGAGIETSSHKYGLIHNICVSYEFVLASGEVVKCTETENTDLYYAVPGSHGTLGFLTAVEMEIIRAKSHVRLEYIPVHSLDEAISTFEKQTYRKDGNEFVEGIMYSLDKGVIMVGEMTSEPDWSKVNEIGKWYKPWFYSHAKKYLNKSPNEDNPVEYIPLRDYYHRHTRGLFWETGYFVAFGNNVIFRYLLGWVLPLRIDIIKLITPSWVIGLLDSNHVTQDFIVPMDKLKDAIILSHQIMEVYPLWLCPVTLKNTPGVCHFLGEEDEMYVDLGIYGMSKLDNYDLVKCARALEIFCIKYRGYQALYSDVCMTREEFGKMFKPELYLKMRKELDCEDAFPDVYEKVCKEARR